MTSPLSQKVHPRVAALLANCVSGPGAPASAATKIVGKTPPKSVALACIEALAPASVPSPSAGAPSASSAPQMGWRGLEYLNKYYKPDQVTVLVKVKTKKGEYKDDEVS